MANNNENINENENNQNANNAENHNDKIKADDKNKAAPGEMDTAYVDMFLDKLRTFNDMYNTKVSRDKLVSNLSDSWKMMTDENEEKRAGGKKQFKGIFEAILSHAFEVDKKTAYNEGRFPDYTEIVKSGNELMRAAMFAFTDMYSNKEREALFDQTAFGGMSADEITALTGADGVWKLDQKSDEAWQIQSKEAKDIATEWQKKSNPYQTMIDEMDELIKRDKSGSLERKDVLNKLAAAEWLLINNDDMMIKDADDPINKTPKWGNRYWNAITRAREAIGIPKYVSMRDLIQGNYAVMQKTMSNANYHKDHVNDQIFDPEKRAAIDSKDKQSEQFIIQSAKIAENKPIDENRMKDMDMVGDKVRISIIEEDEYLKAKSMPKDMSSFVFEIKNEVNMDIKAGRPMEMGKGSI